MIKNALLRVWAVFRVAAKRLRSQGKLSLAALTGLIALVALVMSIPAYADAVSYRILSTNLLGDANHRVLPDAPRAPFIFAFEYSGPFRGATQWEQVLGLDGYLQSQVIIDLGLPLKSEVRLLKSYAFQLFAPQDVETPGREKAFSWASFYTLSDVETHIKVVEGEYPAVAGDNTNNPVDVLVSEALATQMGLMIGENYIAYNQDTESTVKIPVRIAGIWQAIDPEDAYWPILPKELSADLLVPEDTYLNYLAANMKDEVNQAAWRLALDSTFFHAGDVPALISRIARVEIQAASLIKGAYLAESPQALLLDYRKTTNLLTFSLLAFSVPVAALLLAFINLVSSVMVDRQRNEIAVMRSRGATLMQMVGISTLEGLLLVAVAWLAGIPVSKGIIFLMGKTRSFMDFSLPASLRLDVTNLALVFGAGAALLVLAARLMPVAGAARQTIITYKQESARTLRPPWWQRAYFDLFLFIPAAYGTYLLRTQGSMVLEGSTYNDPFQNPLLLLIPALGIFSITLFMLRLLPKVMAGIAWLAGRANALSLLLAAQHLARAPGFYSVPLMLLVLTLSLSAFTATLAETLDTHYHDQQYYYTGADVYLIEYGQCLKYNKVGQCDANAPTDTSPTWSFLPVSVHLKAPGVQAAARVGSWTARATTGGNTQAGRFMAIDRLDFPKVAFWRNDFGSSSLGALMNDLAFMPDGVLVPQDFMKREVLSVGDRLTLYVDIGNKSMPVDLTIAGAFDLFPTWYPDAGPLFVGNLDYFFLQIQGQHPYNIWLKTSDEVTCPPLVETLRNKADLGLDVQGCISARQKIVQEQKRPEHQGLFGLLSIGFAAAAVFTVLGFLLYALFSFQRRFIEMGILRAIGISFRQMTLFLGWELGLLIAIGATAGTALGLTVSRLFIPYLQFGEKAAAQVPPFVVQIAWGRIFQIYALFGLLFIAALVGLAQLLARMKVFQAIKLGETA